MRYRRYWKTTKTGAIDQLAGSRPEEVANLKRIEVATITELWERVGTNADQGIDKLANASTIDKNILTTLLCFQAKREADASCGTWLERNLLEILLVMLTAVAAILALQACSEVMS